MRSTILNKHASVRRRLEKKLQSGHVVFARPVSRFKRPASKVARRGALLLVLTIGRRRAEATAENGVYNEAAELSQSACARYSGARPLRPKKTLTRGHSRLYLNLGDFVHSSLLL